MTAICFEPESCDVSGPVLYGRRVAGNGFLRALVKARNGSPVVGYGLPSAQAAFAQLVREVDPQAEAGWINRDRLDLLSRAGVCHRLDPMLASAARLRLRVNPQAYALCGVVHTVSTMLPQLAALAAEPLAPWDAIICTSNAVAETVRRTYEEAGEQLRWRFGSGAEIPSIALPVIPLGVDCAQFAASPAERAAARHALGLADDEVVALSLGRISIFTKGHPAPMYLGLDAAARRTGAKVTLVQCGLAAPDTPLDAVRNAASAMAGNVRHLMLDGKDDLAVRRCWAAADVFISLSDNVQESFGLTPVEAMAAGLPAVVSDWNGYRETVRDGVDGFRIPTWAPPPQSGRNFALAHEMGSLPHNLPAWSAAASTSVDLATLVDRLAALISSPDLRQQMARAGQARARDVYDWQVVLRQYAALWRGLDARRTSASSAELAWCKAAPRYAAGNDDLFSAFRQYPTHHLVGSTIVSLAAGATPQSYRAIVGTGLFPLDPAPEHLALRIIASLGSAPETAEMLARRCDAPFGALVLVLGALAKMGVVTLQAPADGAP